MVSGFEPIVREIEMQQEMMETPYTQFEFIEGVLSFYFNDVGFSLRKYDLEIKNNSAFIISYFFKKIASLIPNTINFRFFFSVFERRKVY